MLINRKGISKHKFESYERIRGFSYYHNVIICSSSDRHIITMKLNADILFCAFRYALGRKTYAVNDVSDCIIQNWDELPGIIQNAIKKEIRTAIIEDKAGMKQDIKAWLRILDLQIFTKNK